MKLRCTHNSVRIRIRKSELGQLARDQQLTESLFFPTGQRFDFSLLFRAGEEQFAAHFTNGHLQVQLPDTATQHWLQDQTVGQSTSLALPNGQSLHIVVEKDFPCKDRTEEDKTDFFGELADQNDAVC